MSFMNLATLHQNLEYLTEQFTPLRKDNSHQYKTDKKYRIKTRNYLESNQSREFAIEPINKDCQDYYVTSHRSSLMIGDFILIKSLNFSKRYQIKN